MKGSAVVTSDDEKIGEVAGEFGEYLIVETGTVFKAKHAVPKSYATAREDGTLCVTVPKRVVLESPKVDFDFQAVAAHYGLAFDDGSTEGYGEVDPDDTRWGPDQDAAAAGLLTAEQRRAQVRQHRHSERAQTSSPGLLGGRTPKSK